MTSLVLAHQQERLRSISTRLVLKVSKRARRMTLRLDPDSRHVHLVVPLRINFDRAFDFAEQHRRWIREKLGSLPQPVPFRHGAVLPLFGQDHVLEIHRDPTARATTISVKNRVITVVTNKEDPTARIERYLRAWSEKILDGMAREKAALIRRRIESVKVRETKSRWGSCAQDGRLSFSWRLIFAPREVADYVVAHEVSHLVHFNHSASFWALCARLSDNYEPSRDWLRAHGHGLLAYG